MCVCVCVLREREREREREVTTPAYRGQINHSINVMLFLTIQHPGKLKYTANTVYTSYYYCTRHIPAILFTSDFPNWSQPVYSEIYSLCFFFFTCAVITNRKYYIYIYITSVLIFGAHLVSEISYHA